MRVLPIPSTLRLSTCSTPSVRVNSSSYRDAGFMVIIYDAAILDPSLIRQVYNAIPCHRSDTTCATYLGIHPRKQEMVHGTEIIHKRYAFVESKTMFKETKRLKRRIIQADSKDRRQSKASKLCAIGFKSLGINIGTPVLLTNINKPVDLFVLLF